MNAPLHLSQGCVSKLLCQTRRTCPSTLPRTSHVRPGWSSPVKAASERGAVDIRQLSDIITTSAVESEERQHTLEEMSKALGEPLATVKNMIFRQKALLSLDPAEVKSRIDKVAQIVDVPYDQARQMCVIQPGLLTDTERQAEALQYGLRIICHDLKASKEEIVALILHNPSLLHGRQMRLSVADMAHLALLREPRGRIVD